jgi:hypothetical protein
VLTKRKIMEKASRTYTESTEQAQRPQRRSDGKYFCDSSVKLRATPWTSVVYKIFIPAVCSLAVT